MITAAQRPSRARAHRLALTLLALAALATPTAARAPGMPEGPWRTLTVAVLPVTYLGGLADPLADPPEAPRLRADAARWHRGLEVAFQGRDQVELIGTAELRERLARQTVLRRTASLAQERYALGLEQWRALRAKEALVQLDRARELHLEAFTDLVDPRTLADVELHRGLALVDLGEIGPARIAFAQMFALDPTRRFERGYYGGPIEHELTGAARDIASLPAPIPILWPAERLAALARRLEIDVWAVGLVTDPEPLSPREPFARAPATTDTAAQIDVALFDVRAVAFTARETFPIGADDFMAVDLDRFVASWHACALEAPSPFLRPRARRQWFVELGYAHAVWLHHRRTRDYLHGPGAHIGITYLPTPGLELWFKTSQRATLSDANADLLDVFTTTHFGLGAGLGLGDETLAFTLRAGVEVAFSLADIAMTTDVDCKFFGAEHPRCRGIFRAESPALWLGLDFAASLRVAPTRAWYLAWSAGTTIYAISGSLVGELNFPLYGTLAFGLPF